MHRLRRVRGSQGLALRSVPGVVESRSSEDFATIAREIGHIAGPAVGFALLMRLADGHYHYASNAERADVVNVFNEWLTRAGVVNARDPGETQARARGRLTLEDKCARLGDLLGLVGHRIVLFLFDFGDHGSLAWKSSAPDPRGVVESFLQTVATS